MGLLISNQVAIVTYILCKTCYLQTEAIFVVYFYCVLQNEYPNYSLCIYFVLHAGVLSYILQRIICQHAWPF